MNNNDNTSVAQNGLSGTCINIDGRRLPTRIFIVCLIAELLFVLLDAVVNYAEFSEYGQIRRLFNITREDSLATWFMVIQTFVAGLLLGLIALVQRSRGDSRRRMAGWVFLAGFFIYMSADDGAKIHERLGSMFASAYESRGSVVQDSLVGKVQALFPSYDWQLVALPLLAAAGLFMLLFLWREFHVRNERLLLVTAAGCMVLAVALDFIEGLDGDHGWNIQLWILETFSLSKYTVRHFAKSLEEFLEMLAISLLLMLFVRHLIRVTEQRLTLNFSPGNLS
jgi:hypothetical protein